MCFSVSFWRVCLLVLPSYALAGSATRGFCRPTEFSLLRLDRCRSLNKSGTRNVCSGLLLLPNISRQVVYLSVPQLVRVKCACARRSAQPRELACHVGAFPAKISIMVRPNWRCRLERLQVSWRGDHTGDLLLCKVQQLSWFLVLGKHD